MDGGSKLWGSRKELNYFLIPVIVSVWVGVCKGDVHVVKVVQDLTNEHNTL